MTFGQGFENVGFDLAAADEMLEGRDESVAALAHHAEAAAWSDFGGGFFGFDAIAFFHNDRRGDPVGGQFDDESAIGFATVEFHAHGHADMARDQGRQP